VKGGPINEARRTAGDVIDKDPKKKSGEASLKSKKDWEGTEKKEGRPETIPEDNRKRTIGRLIQVSLREWEKKTRVPYARGVEEQSWKKQSAEPQPPKKKKLASTSNALKK